MPGDYAIRTGAKLSQELSEELKAHFKQGAPTKCGLCGAEYEVWHFVAYQNEALAEGQKDYLQKNLAAEHRSGGNHPDVIVLPAGFY